VAKIFIDGEHGTTGLQIRSRLSARSDLEIISLKQEHRKDITARTDYLNASDIAILCLPDDAARESVSLITNSKTVVIDASTAHRTSEGWVYGFAEMDSSQSALISQSKRISNPGCWPQGPIALIRPLVSLGLLPNDFSLIMGGVSGYSGGGKQMIEDYELNEKPNFMPYGLNLQHKHVAELQTNALLSTAPLLQPAVGNFAQGMITMVPLALQSLSKIPTGAQIHSALSDYYAGIKNSFVRVAPFDNLDKNSEINPQIHNNTNWMTLHVHANNARAQVVLIAVYDNLGKGASGSAVQNLDLVLREESGRVKSHS
jgi:N-acetyl-gamma-glutamyl-phosphate reductase